MVLQGREISKSLDYSRKYNEVQMAGRAVAQIYYYSLNYTETRESFLVLQDRSMF